MVQNALKNKSIYYTLQKKQLGTAHAVLQCQSLLKNFDGNKFDATDALGAAICHYYQKSSNQTPPKSWKNFIVSNPDKII